VIVLNFLCFVVGGMVGWSASRGGARVKQAWPLLLRMQVLATAALLSLAAAWRLTTPGELIAPLVLAGGLWVVFVVAVLTRENHLSGAGALEAWAVSPNTGFWVVPMAAALVGTPAVMIAVLANLFGTVISAVCVHLMRRDAPIRQRRSTSWVDQSPLLASVIGLLLHSVRSAPSFTQVALTLAGPLLAFSGAALFAASVIHPHNMAVDRTSHSLQRWAWLTVLRVAYFLPIALFASSIPLAVVAAVSALGAPAFSPIQQALLYGYRSTVVNAAVRWGWLLAPLGLGLAVLLRWE
jgi:hypothetical protein